MKIDESKFRFRIGDKVLYKGEEYNIVAYYFPGGFNKYTFDYGYVIDSPLHDGGGCSYDENGVAVFFPGKSVFWALESNVNPVKSDLTIADRLRYAPKGMELYSIAHGKVIFVKVNDRNIITVNKNTFLFSFQPNGQITDFPDSECLLFPSKENRDWITVDYSKPKRQDLPTDTVCIVAGGNFIIEPCYFRHYAYKSTCYNNGKKSHDGEKTIAWAHIVPVDKFDFKNLTFKPEDDYGTKSEYNG